MMRFATMAIVASLSLAACGHDEWAATSPTSPSGGTFVSADGPSVGGKIQSGSKPTRSIGGAVVEVVSGANIGKSAMSDQGGAFGLMGLSQGPITLRVSRPGYQTWTSKEFDLEADTKIAVDLFPLASATDAARDARGPQCESGACG
jgi:hypothetical protein